MKRSLHILSGASGETEIPLESGSYTFGRGEDAAIRINSRQVSRQHAELLIEGDHVKILDFGSSNGTYVNGSSITSCELEPGDRIEIGDVTFEYRATQTQRPIEYSPREERSIRKVFFKSTNRSAGASRRTYMPGSPLFLPKLVRATQPAQKGEKRTFSLRLVFIGSITAIFSTLALFGGLSYKNILEDRLARESLGRAQSLVRYLAEKNREDLRSGNELLLDVETVRKESGVQDAMIINKKGELLAPISRTS